MPTALQLGPTGWQSYIRMHKRHSTPPATDKTFPRAELLAKAREAARRIKRELGACRVVLFGSLAHSAWHDSHSDVDLAVEGLTGHAYLEAWRIAEDTIRDHRVEIIEIEAASPALRRAIERDGVPL